jgi:hypothetical protein
MNVKPFFDNRDFVVLVDKMAKRYGKTPYEVVAEMTIEEFRFNTAVLYVALMEERKNADKDPDNPDGGQNLPLSSFGIDRTVVKKEK